MIFLIISKWFFLYKHKKSKCYLTFFKSCLALIDHYSAALKLYTGVTALYISAVTSNFIFFIISPTGYGCNPRMNYIVRRAFMLNNKEKIKPNCEYISSSVKIKNMTVNIKSCFYPEKSLYEILFSIVSTKLKEKSA